MLQNGIKIGLGLWFMVRLLITSQLTTWQNHLIQLTDKPNKWCIREAAGCLSGLRTFIDLLRRDDYCVFDTITSSYETVSDLWNVLAGQYIVFTALSQRTTAWNPQTSDPWMHPWKIWWKKGPCFDDEEGQRRLSGRLCQIVSSSFLSCSQIFVCLTKTDETSLSFSLLSRPVEVAAEGSSVESELWGSMCSVGVQWRSKPSAVTAEGDRRVSFIHLLVQEQQKAHFLCKNSHLINYTNHRVKPQQRRVSDQVILGPCIPDTKISEQNTKSLPLTVDFLNHHLHTKKTSFITGEGERRCLQINIDTVSHLIEVNGRWSKYMQSLQVMLHPQSDYLSLNYSPHVPLNSGRKLFFSYVMVNEESKTETILDELITYICNWYVHSKLC